MRQNGTPPHTGNADESDVEEGELMYERDDDDEDFDDDELVEVLDEDMGNLGDDEEDDDDMVGVVGGERGPGLEGFTGQHPDHILTSHLENAVFCCCFSGDEDNKVLVTGGEDDMANVWDEAGITSQHPEPSFKCRGHKDSVVHVSFNWDSSYLATCDLSGVVKIWKPANQFECVATFEATDLSWSFWHFGSNVLFAGCDDGSIFMWKVPSGDCKMLTGSSTKCECGILLPDGKRLLAGYTDGTLKIFDLKTCQVQNNLAKSSSSGGANLQHTQILCVAAHPTKQLVASGNADGTVALFHSQNGKLLLTFQIHLPHASTSDEDSSGDKSVEGMAFSSSSDSTCDFLACGAVNGDIVIWDVTSMSERLRLTQEVGLTKLLWDPVSPLLYTAGLDGVLRVIDCRTCNVAKLLGRHKTEILDMALTKDGSKLASASEDGTVFLFSLVAS